MAKQIAVDTETYQRLVSLSGKLTAVAKKQITLGLTVGYSAALAEVFLQDPRIESAFLDNIQNSKDPLSTWNLVVRKVSQPGTKG
jgi:hypothetical protein